MANIKFSEDLFLEIQELNRFKKFIDEDGFRRFLKFNAYQFGLLRLKDDVDELLNFKVEAGTNNKTIKIANDSYAIDGNGKVIYKKAEDNIPVPDDGNFYWVRIRYLVSNLEVGTVDVDTSGNMTDATGGITKFLEVLRGQPNFPVKVIFPNASLNTGKYEVAQVVDDETAVLSGILQAENDLEYAVIGTFTPDFVPDSNDEQIYEYDSCVDLGEYAVGMIEETGTPGEPPPKSGADYLEFYIARVKVVGTSVSIEDKRVEFFQTRAEYLYSVINAGANNLIGIEFAKYDNSFSVKDHNIVRIGWGFRSSNYTVSSDIRRITLSGGEGGIFKDTDDFSDNDLDGWVIYVPSGKKYRIIESLKSSTQINLEVEALNVDDFDGSEIIIVPNVEEIQLKFSADNEAIENVDKITTHPIEHGYSDIRLLVPSTTTYSYRVEYRYKKFETYTEWEVLPDDTANGYYDETSFDTDGVLEADPGDRNRKTYEPSAGDADDGFLELIANEDSYINFQTQIDKGDLIGTGSQEIVNGVGGTDKLYDLNVGVQYQSHIFYTSSNITFTRNHVINLKTAGAVNGSSFKLQIIPYVDSLGAYTFKIKEDNTLTLLTISAIDCWWIMNRSKNGIIILAEFDGTNWFLKTQESYDGHSSADVDWVAPTVNSGFDISGISGINGIPLRYKFNTDGSVSIAGTCIVTPSSLAGYSAGSPSTATMPSIIFTLPAKYRPSVGARFFVCKASYGSPTGDTVTTIELQVHTDGTVGILHIATNELDDLSSFSVDGVRFFP